VSTIASNGPLPTRRNWPDGPAGPPVASPAVPTFQAPIGTRDLLPPDSSRVRGFVACFAEVVEQAGYGLVVPPLFEDLGVFLRIGEATDVVTKEMYDFLDKGGRHLALRPEMTAGVVRAFVEHRPVTPWKVWYAGANFRYEKAQKGRYRQFDQVGVEVLGAEDPYVDVEVIALAWRFYEALGLQRLTLLLNSLGDPGDRARYVDALRSHFSANLDALSPESRQTLERNPLRVLDSKRDSDRPLLDAAPGIDEFWSEASAAHLEVVKAGLRDLGIPFVDAPRLVRGLDYYRRTTFEFAAEALDAAQNAVGGGGRYDGLTEDLGGPPTPGIGFALGVDRTLLACDAEGAFPPPSLRVEVFVVDTTGGREALVLTDELRRAGLRADRAFDGRSMKSQMKAADRSGAAVALLVGSQELESGVVTLRVLRGDAHEQQTVPRAEVIDHVRKALR
jgi:histidyl-tRNA synthetase